MFYHSNYLIFRINKLNKDFCLSDSTNSFHFKVHKLFCAHIVLQSVCWWSLTRCYYITYLFVQILCVVAAIKALKIISSVQRGLIAQKQTAGRNSGPYHHANTKQLVTNNKNQKLSLKSSQVNFKFFLYFLSE